MLGSLPPRRVGFPFTLALRLKTYLTETLLPVRVPRSLDSYPTRLKTAVYIHNVQSLDDVSFTFVAQIEVVMRW
eukprot:scaffold347_cov380-Prasinococcus_capsulatus_cf.AAC.19